MKIKITQHNMCDRPNVTGAALRSVISAEETAQIQIDNITATAMAFENAFDLANANLCALNLALAHEAATAFYASTRTCAALALPKRVRVSVYSDAHWRPNCWFTSRSIDQSIAELSEMLFNKLTDAGIPLEENGKLTSKYWRDAAARGC